MYFYLFYCCLYVCTCSRICHSCTPPQVASTRVPVICIQNYKVPAVAGFLGIRGKYLKSRGHNGANELRGDMIPTSANKLGTHAQIACAGQGFTISGPSRSKCIHPLRNQYTTALSDRRIDSKFSTHFSGCVQNKRNQRNGKKCVTIHPPTLNRDPTPRGKKKKKKKLKKLTDTK